MKPVLSAEVRRRMTAYPLADLNFEVSQILSTRMDYDHGAVSPWQRVTTFLLNSGDTAVYRQVGFNVGLNIRPGDTVTVCDIMRTLSGALRVRPPKSLED